MTLKATRLLPVEWFASLGLLGRDFHAVHGVWLSETECELLAQHDTTVTHCPAANMILASGIAPVAKLLRMGVNVALATDGPASNDGQDMIEMMRLAAYLARVSTLDPQALSPRQAIDMATVNGVKALTPPSSPLGKGGRLSSPPYQGGARGGEDAIYQGSQGRAEGDEPSGRLAPGAPADLILIDLNAAHIQPIGDVTASLVYNARGSDVDTVVVDGRVLMAYKHFQALDEAALLDECRARAAHLAARAGITAESSGMLPI
jgi:5-methylthioadenosine/S-adenosylhomocysteine deaminase